MEKQEVVMFIDWINNNWLIPVEDGYWSVDINHEEYQDTFKGYFTNTPLLDGEELLNLFLSGKGS